MKSRHEKRMRRLDHIAAMLGILAFLMLIVRYGFPGLGIPQWALFAWAALLPLGFFLEAMYRLLWVEDPWRYLALHPWRYIILLMIMLELSGVAAWSAGGMARRVRAGAQRHRRSASAARAA